MKEKRFNKIFIIIFGAIILFIGLLNFLTDPFNVFGDRLMKWYTYDFTQNPRTAKIEYIKGKGYENFIVGASGASSIPSDLLKKYTGRDYFNLFSYGADLYVVEKNVDYLLKIYKPKSIIMPLGLPSATKFNEERSSLNYYMNPDVSGESKINFYLKYLLASPQNGFSKIKSYFNRSYVQEPFDTFKEDGSYDKSKRDIEYIGSIEDYKRDKGFNIESFPVKMDHMDEAMGAIEHIKKSCQERNCQITFLLCPMYEEQNKRYDPNEIKTFYKKLSEITDFWDFTGTKYDYDPRFYYDPSHFRNALGKMMVERIYGLRDDFGRYVKGEAEPVTPAREIDEKSFYIYAFHHISENPDPSNPYVVSPKRFEEFLKFLKENEIKAINFKDLYNYVNEGKNLPEKFCLMTFDDGYESNYKYAYPLLKKYGQRANFFPIGRTMGLSKYPGLEKEMFPHYSVEKAREMNGIIEYGSHTYFLHQSYENPKLEFRQTAKRLEGESENKYILTFKEDSQKFKDLYKNFGRGNLITLAYPEGDYDELSEFIVEKEGYKITLTSDEGKNTIVKNLPESLKKLKRVNIDENRDLNELK
ncbi:polysaccharide deacetylase family protein [uncultured Peptoniphilus sp.]|uniref:polysaccharide deacetylase family protein n=1 Tax=uncultured Peptoniphilus sp. TaxID=254354 RepID=UPI00280588BB|nr:polysaccharide deacetylase family protein [uncultured Peptoniphilus sp.]